MSASAIVVKMERGNHVLTVDGYSNTKEVRGGRCLYSCTFPVGGHTWRLRYFPNGLDEDWEESIVIILDHVGPDEAVDADVQFDLLDHAGRADPLYSRRFTRTFSPGSLGFCYPWEIRRKILEKVCLKDDCFVIQCHIAFVRGISVEKPSVKAPPPKLDWHLGDLLGNAEGADVTFKVGGETFVAHRYVLAARSLVFKAQLLGSMKEKDKGCVIHIDDVHADVFRALLQFIYTDELPETGEDCAAIMAQHLLVAADMYDIPRLKLICEDKLCKLLDVSTAATTLALAEQHHCHELKEAVFRFLTLPSNMETVRATDGYKYLMASYPSLCKEMTSRHIVYSINSVN